MSPRFPTSQTTLRAFLLCYRRMNELCTAQTGRAASVEEKEISKTVLLYWTAWILSGQIFYRRHCSLFTIQSLTHEEQEVTRKRREKQDNMQWSKLSFSEPFQGGSRLKLPKDTTTLQKHKNSRPCPRDNHMFKQRNQQVNAEKTAPSWRKATGKQEDPWPSQPPPILIAGWPQAPTNQRPAQLNGHHDPPAHHPRIELYFLGGWTTPPPAQVPEDRDERRCR